MVLCIFSATPFPQQTLAWCWYALETHFRTIFDNVYSPISTETVLVLRKCSITLASFPLCVLYLTQTVWQCLIQICMAITLYLWYMWCVTKSIYLTRRYSDTWPMWNVSNHTFLVLKIHICIPDNPLPGAQWTSLIAQSLSLDPYYPDVSHRW